MARVVRNAPMYLQQLPSGSWRVTVSNDGARRRATAPTKGEARRLGAQLLLEMGGLPASTPTVAEIIDAHMATADYAPRTRENAEGAIGKLPAVFTSRRIIDVTPSVVAGLWVEMTTAGRTLHELKKIRDVLSLAWAKAIRLDWATSNPILLAPPPAPPQGEEIVPPTTKTVRAIITGAGDRPLATCLRLAAVTGARRGELVALQWDDLRLDVGEIIIRRSVAEMKGELVIGATKTGRGGHRVIPLDRPTVTALRKHPRVVGSPYVFTFGGATPWRPGYLSREYNHIVTRLGIEGHFHELRHFAATQWLAAGVPVPTVAYMLGHASPATTLRTYAHFIPAQGRDAIVAHAAAIDAAG